MKLNVGCGNHYAPDWVNLDLAETEDVHPDVIGDITGRTGFNDNSAERIYLGHVLEHLAVDDVAAALAECGRLLQPDGSMMVVGPDCDLADAMLVAGSIGTVEHELVVTGAGRWAGDVHQWRSTGPVTTAQLRIAGFVAEPMSVYDVDDSTWPLTSQIGWQFAILACPRVTS
jgi:hypothetical protein